MTCVSAVQIPEESLSVEVSKMLWDVAKIQGVQIPQEKEESLMQGLVARINCFHTHFLAYMPEAMCTNRMLTIEKTKATLAPIRQERDVVSAEQVNRLVYGWMCAFLLLGFRGITQKETPDIVKSEALWFLGALNYVVDPPHEISRLAIRHSLTPQQWDILCFNDSVLGDMPSASPVWIPPSDICKKCPIRRPATAHIQ